MRQGTAEVGGANWAWGVNDERLGKAYLVVSRTGSGGTGTVHEYRYFGKSWWEGDSPMVKVGLGHMANRPSMTTLRHAMVHTMVPSAHRNSEKRSTKYLEEIAGVADLYESVTAVERFCDRRHQESHHMGYHEWCKLEPEMARRLGRFLGGKGL